MGIPQGASRVPQSSPASVIAFVVNGARRAPARRLVLKEGPHPSCSHAEATAPPMGEATPRRVRLRTSVRRHQALGGVTNEDSRDVAAFRD